MANKLYEESYIQAIANAIRAKGQTGTMKVSQMAVKIGNISTKETVTWHQCPEAVRNYLDQVIYDPSDYTTSRIAEFAPATAVSSNTKPVGKTVDDVAYYNEVPNVATPFSSANSAGTLKPLDKLRWINSATSNVRDLGGWNCDGGTIKYGRLLRGGEANIADKELMVGTIGVRHELQLRGEGEAPQDYSVWGVEFSVFDTFHWYSISNKALWRKELRVIFDCIALSKPVFFHCSAGADRTGTLACIIEAILGMSQSDIDKDYELTCFASGSTIGSNGRRRDEADWQGLINEIKTVPLIGGLADTFRNRAISFVLSLGFTVAEINAFRTAMIEGTPAAIVATIPTNTITKTLTHVNADNTSSTIAQYQPYEVRLIPDDGYVIDSITVTMGGNDITAQVFKGTETNLNRSVNKTLSHCSFAGRLSVIDGQDFVCELTADAGYTLSEEAGASIVITVGGTQVYPIV